MDIEIPPDLQWVSYLAGGEWPQGSETRTRRIGEHYQAAAEQLQELIPELSRVRGETLSVLFGETADAAEKQFAMLFDGDYAVDRLVTGISAMGEGATNFGTEIEYSKLSIIVGLALAAAEISWCLANAGPTYGASTALIPVIEQTTVLTIRQIVMAALRRLLAKMRELLSRTMMNRLFRREMIRASIREAGQELAQGLTQEGIVQGIQAKNGHADFRWDRFKTTAIASTVGGGAGGASALPVGAALGPARNRITAATKGATVMFTAGVVGNVAGTMSVGGEFDTLAILAGSTTTSIGGLKGAGLSSPNPQTNNTDPAAESGPTAPTGELTGLDPDGPSDLDSAAKPDTESETTPANDNTPSAAAPAAPKAAPSNTVNGPAKNAVAQHDPSTAKQSATGKTPTEERSTDQHAAEDESADSVTDQSQADTSDTSDTADDIQTAEPTAGNDHVQQAPENDTATTQYAQLSEEHNAAAAPMPVAETAESAAAADATLASDTTQATDSMQSEPVQDEIVPTEPTQAETVQTEPVQADPVQVDPAAPAPQATPHVGPTTTSQTAAAPAAGGRTEAQPAAPVAKTSTPVAREEVSKSPAPHAQSEKSAPTPTSTSSDAAGVPTARVQDAVAAANQSDLGTADQVPVVDDRSDDCADRVAQALSNRYGRQIRLAPFTSERGRPGIQLFEATGSAAQFASYADVNSVLGQMAPGSSAVLVSAWSGGPNQGGHAYLAVNDNGQLFLEDPNTGRRSPWPPGWGQDAVLRTAVGYLDSSGRAVDPFQGRPQQLVAAAAVGDVQGHPPQGDPTPDRNNDGDTAPGERWRSVVPQSMVADSALARRIPPVQIDGVRNPLGMMEAADARARSNAAWWSQLTGAEQLALIETYPQHIGNAEGIPASARHRANTISLSESRSQLQALRDSGHRLSRSQSKLLARLDQIDAALTRAEQLAQQSGLGGPQLLSFDHTAFGGDGRAVVSFGADPYRADSVSWHVPGQGITIDQVGAFMGDALNHLQSTTKENPEVSAASIAWIGYDTPSGLSSWRAAGHTLAREGGAILYSDIRAFNAARDTLAGDGSHFSGNHVFAHSYGTTATSYAGRDGRLANDVRTISLIGSPGTGPVRAAADFGIGDNVFVASSSRDPFTALGGRNPGSAGRIFGLGLGADPAMNTFGAQRVTAEFSSDMDRARSRGTHNSYYRYADRTAGVRSESLANFGRIAAGHADRIDTDTHRTVDTQPRRYFGTRERTVEPAAGRPLRLEGETSTQGDRETRRPWNPRWQSEVQATAELDTRTPREIANEALDERGVKPKDIMSPADHRVSVDQAVDRARANAHWWAGLSEAQRQALIETYPFELGNAEGIPPLARHQANSIMLERNAARRDLMVSQRDNGIALTEAQEKFIKLMDDIESALRTAERNAVRHGIGGPYLLALDPDAFGGVGRAIVSFGADPYTAQSVSWYVPGMTTTIERLGTIMRRGFNQLRSTLQESPDLSAASITYLGYQPPGSWDPRVGFQRMARNGGQIFASDIASFNTGRDIFTGDGSHFSGNHVFAHSYGSTTVSHAGHGRRLADQVQTITLIGSPGAGPLRTAADFGIGDNVFVAASSRDQTTGLGGEHAGDRGRMIRRMGQGIDPAMDIFGARRITSEFPVALDHRGAGSRMTHSLYWAYMDPGTLQVRSESLANFGRIAAGHADQVHTEGHRTLHQRRRWLLGGTREQTVEPATGRPLRLTDDPTANHSVEGRHFWNPRFRNSPAEVSEAQVPVDDTTDVARAAQELPAAETTDVEQTAVPDRVVADVALAERGIKAADLMSPADHRVPVDQAVDRARANAHWWAGLSEAQRQALIKTYPHEVGNAEGIPPKARHDANSRMLRRYLDHRDLLLSRRENGVALSKFESNYIDLMHDIESGLRSAQRNATRLNVDGPFLLALDPQAFGGVGRAIVSFGADPYTAQSVSWYVPGMTTTIGKLRAMTMRAVNLLQSTLQENPGLSAASITYIGYQAPGSWDPRVGFQRMARNGGQIFASDIASFNVGRDVFTGDGSHFSGNHVFAHSYGSTTVSHAGFRGRLADHVRTITLIGSPGAGPLQTAADFGIGDNVFVAASSRDRTTGLGGERRGDRGRTIRQMGQGIDPAMDIFEARRITAEFPAARDHMGAGSRMTHSLYWSYLDPGTLRIRSESLTNFGRIAAGHANQVDTEGHRTLDERRRPVVGGTREQTVEPALGRPLRLADDPAAHHSVHGRNRWNPNFLRSTNCAYAVAEELSVRYGRDITVDAPISPRGVPARSLFEAVGSTARFASYSDVEATLQRLGPGSSAVLASRWRGRGEGGHAYLAVNDGGTIYLLDPHTGRRSSWPPHWGRDAVKRTAVGYLDAGGAPVNPLDGNTRRQLLDAEAVGHVQGDRTQSADQTIADDALAQRTPAVRPDELRNPLGVPEEAAARARNNATWWAGLSETQQQALIETYPQHIGNAEGIPAAARDAANRNVLQELRDRADRIQTKIDEFDRPTRAERKFLAKIDQLDRALDKARADTVRAGEDGPLLLAFDPQEFGGDGRVLLSFGHDPYSANSVSWHVPGVQTTMHSLLGFYSHSALNHLQSVRAENPELKAASIAWIGYDAPSGRKIWRAVGHRFARTGGDILHSDISAFNAVHQTTSDGQAFTGNHVFGYSYGSTTTGYAGRDGRLGDHVSTVTLVGSPGVGPITQASEFGIGADNVFAASSSRDVVTALGGRTSESSGRVLGLGLGVDPAMHSFGAVRVTAEFPSGLNRLLTGGTHHAYFLHTPSSGRSESLVNLGRIASGHSDRVTVEPHRTVEGRHTVEPAAGSSVRRIWNLPWRTGQNCAQGVAAELSAMYGREVRLPTQPTRSGVPARALFEAVGTDATFATYAEVEQRLRELGDGSSTVLASRWSGGRGGGHAYLAVNVGGDIQLVDSHRGRTGWPPHWGQEAVSRTAVGYLDPTGKPVGRSAVDAPLRLTAADEVGQVRGHRDDPDFAQRQAEYRAQDRATRPVDTRYAEPLGDVVDNASDLARVRRLAEDLSGRYGPYRIQLSADENLPGDVVLTGEIFNGDTKIGTIQRQFDRDSAGNLVAYHTGLVIEGDSPHLRGQGFSKALTAELERYYVDSGVDYIELKSHDAGSNAWARRGFTWDPQPHRLAGSLDSIKSAAARLAPSLSPEGRAVLADMVARLEPGHPRLPEPFEVATLATAAEPELGRQLLRNTEVNFIRHMPVAEDRVQPNTGLMSRLQRWLGLGGGQSSGQNCAHGVAAELTQRYERPFRVDMQASRTGVPAWSLFRAVGSTAQFATYDEVAATLHDLGDGSSAVLASRWAGGRQGGHAYLAVNDGGQIYLVDPHTGKRSGWPPHWGQQAVDRTAVGYLDADGAAVRPLPQAPLHVSLSVADGIGDVRGQRATDDFAARQQEYRAQDSATRKVDTSYAQPMGEIVDSLDPDQVRRLGEDLSGVYGPYRVEVFRAIADEQTGDVIIGGLIFSGDEEIGFTQQTYLRDRDGNLVAHQNVVEIPDRAFRGKGFSKALTAQLEQYYAISGVDRIELRTEQDGGYAWARQGFSWNPDPAKLKSSLDNVRNAAVRLRDQVSPEAQALLDDVVQRLDPGRPDLPEPIDLAALTTGQEPHLGRDLLTDTYWSGVKYLGAADAIGDVQGLPEYRAQDPATRQVDARHTEPLGEVVDNRDPAQAQRLAEDLSGVYGPYRVEFQAYENPRGVVLNGSIFAGAVEIGSVERMFRRDASGNLVAHHTGVVIDQPRFRGKGFSTAFSSELERFYTRAGIDRIELEAQQDGAHVWARRGFTWDPHQLQASLDDIKASARELAPGLDDHSRAVLDEMVQRLDPERSDLPEPVEIASLSTNEVPELGRRLLEGSTWYAVRYLDGGDPLAPGQNCAHDVAGELSSRYGREYRVAVAPSRTGVPAWSLFQAVGGRAQFATYDEVAQTLRQMPDGSSALLTSRWAGGRQGGHAYLAVKDGGQIYLVDPHTGQRSGWPPHWGQHAVDRTAVGYLDANGDPVQPIQRSSSQQAFGAADTVGDVRGHPRDSDFSARQQEYRNQDPATRQADSRYAEPVGDVVDNSADPQRVQQLAEDLSGRYGAFRVELQRVPDEATGIAGYIFSDGKQVGHIYWSYRRDSDGNLVAFHGMIEITSASHRGKGFSKALAKQLEPFYAHSGVDRIEMEAAWDGAYAWASWGFSWAPELANLQKSLNSIKTSAQRLRPQLGPEAQAVLDEVVQRLDPDHPRLPDPVDLARLAAPGHPDLGRRLLTNTNWHAVRYLDPDAGDAIGDVQGYPEGAEFLAGQQEYRNQDPATRRADTSFADHLAEVVDSYDRQDARQLAEDLSGMYGPYQVEFSVERTIPGESVSLSGLIRSGDTGIGYVSRKFSRDDDGNLVVENTIVRIEDTEYRGRDFSKALTSELERYYARCGVDRIELVSKWQGSNAWARAGFTWTTDQYHLFESLNDIKDAARHLRGQVDTESQAVLDQIVERLQAGHPRLPEPIDLAVLATSAEPQLGRKLLDNTSVHFVKYLPSLSSGDLQASPQNCAHETADALSERYGREFRVAAEPTRTGVPARALYEAVGSASRFANYDQVAETLRQLGDGASAVLTSRWHGGHSGGHAYLAVNDGGEIYLLDGGRRSGWPPHWGQAAVDRTAVGYLDANGDAINPLHDVPLRLGTAESVGDVQELPGEPASPAQLADAALAQRSPAVEAAELVRPAGDAQLAVERAQANAAWWQGLRGDQRQALIETYPAQIGNAEGIPPMTAHEANSRAMQDWLAKGRELQAKLESGVRLGWERHLEMLRAKAVGDALERATDAARRAGIDGPHLLRFDPDAHHGAGVAVIGFGVDPYRAESVSWHIPGRGMTIQELGPGMGSALNHAMSVLLENPTASAASMTWIGYDTMADDAAQAGGEYLHSDISGFNAGRDAWSDGLRFNNNHVFGLCQGSTVAGYAGDQGRLGGEVRTVTLFGSPGLGPMDHARQFGPDIDVYVASSSTDTFTWHGGSAPGARGDFLDGYGVDPSMDFFGAQRITAEFPLVVMTRAGDYDIHNFYYKFVDKDAGVRNESLANFGRIATGHTERVGFESHRSVVSEAGQETKVRDPAAARSVQLEDLRLPDADPADNCAYGVADAVSQRYGRDIQFDTPVTATGVPARSLYEAVGSRADFATYAEVSERLAQLGPGSSAVLTSRWAGVRQGGHAYLAVNDGGEIHLIDTRTGRHSGWPPHWGQAAVDRTAVGYLDEHGNAVAPLNDPSSQLAGAQAVGDVRGLPDDPELPPSRQLAELVDNPDPQRGQQLADDLSGVYGPFRVELEATAVPGSDMVAISGVIFDGETEIGALDWSFNRDDEGKLVAYNGLVTLEPGYRGLGFSKAMLAKLEPFFVRNGVDRVELTSDWQGSNAWARRGFTWGPDLYHLQGALDQIKMRAEDLRNQVSAEGEVELDEMMERLEIGHPRFPEPIDLAVLATEEEPDLGRRLLEHSSIDLVKYLPSAPVDPLAALGLPHHAPGTLSEGQAITAFAGGEDRLRALNDELLRNGVTAEERARQLTEARNALRSWAYGLMNNRVAADWLAANTSNPTFAELVARNEERGLTADAVYEAIIETATHSRLAPGSLSDIETGAVYSQFELGMRALNEQMTRDGVSIEDRAETLSGLRGSLRAWTRELMENRPAAEWLSANESNPSFEDLVARYEGKGLSGDAVYQAIIDGATHSHYAAGTLSDEETRTVYTTFELRMRELRDQLLRDGVSAEERARTMYGMRATIRSWTRSLMENRELADWLNANEPNPTFDELVERNRAKGRVGDEIYEAIVASSTRSRGSVNAELGIDPDNPPELPPMRGPTDLPLPGTEEDST
ncbi:toxin glutamine deamidase domain-containing protein [Mycolicibacterium houstonense]|uniref:toxin glutamine deamidase domain-containing protein n=1 Tax=Mycolicibacterium houstonense TaxID=146021 RepID=UPI000834C606|nr:toxin glutamine deamidase domain-containing protein [Mycolicibacterium houstonense]